MNSTTQQFKQQLPRNMFLQVLSFITHIGVGIVLTPYLVGHLGHAAYGLIPLAGVMTQYVSIVTQTVSSAVGRFLTIALQRNDEQDANRVLNTAFFSYLALALVQVPIFGLIIYYANSIFTIPEPLYWDAITLLICSAISFLISLICGVFGVPIYANNRLDISRTLDIASQIAYIAGIVALFVVYGPALRYVGYVSLVIGVSRTIVTVLIGKRLAPILKLDVHAYDWRKLRELMSMGGWLLVNYMGFLFFLKIDIWVCNRFVSAEAAGDYAAVLQWSNLIRQAGMLLSGVIGPMIIIYYARSEVQQLIRLGKISVRLLTLFLAIPVGILCAFSSSILRLWLGESFAPLSPLMVVMLCHLVINVGITPLFGVRTAMNKVRLPALLSISMGAVNIVLAIVFVQYLGWGVYGVAIAGGLSLSLLNVVWNPIYIASILGQPRHTFFVPLLSGVFVMVILTAIGRALAYCIDPTSWIELILASTATGFLGCLIALALFPRADRQVLLGVLPPSVRGTAVRITKACGYAVE